MATVKAKSTALPPCRTALSIPDFVKPSVILNKKSEDLGRALDLQSRVEGINNSQRSHWG